MVLLMETSNPRICSFYKENPSINFETINLLFIDLFEKLLINVDSNVTTTMNTQILSNISDNRSEINDLKTSVLSLKDVVFDFNKENTNTQNNLNAKIINEIGDLLIHSRKNSHDSSNNVCILLNKIYNSAEVSKLKDYENRDVFFMKRFQKPQIIFESKSIEQNVCIDEITEFNKTVQNHNCHGIFLSQHSGISTKPNYQIEYQRGNILVFLHNVDFSPERIKIAVDIVDSLAVKLREFNNVHDENNIPKPILDDINKEYQLFISQKEALVTIYKDCQKKVLSQIDEIRFPCLDKYLSTKYTTQIPKQGFKCDLCKCFNANNLKALAAHKRGCARKNVFVSISNTL